jgi:hypothetical protein
MFDLVIFALKVTIVVYFVMALLGAGCTMGIYALLF